MQPCYDFWNRATGILVARSASEALPLDFPHDHSAQPVRCCRTRIPAWDAACNGSRSRRRRHHDRESPEQHSPCRLDRRFLGTGSHSDDSRSWSVHHRFQPGDPGKSRAGDGIGGRPHAHSAGRVEPCRDHAMDHRQIRPRAYARRGCAFPSASAWIAASRARARACSGSSLAPGRIA